MSIIWLILQKFTSGVLTGALETLKKLCPIQTFQLDRQNVSRQAKVRSSTQGVSTAQVLIHLQPCFSTIVYWRPVAHRRNKKQSHVARFKFEWNTSVMSLTCVENCYNQSKLGSVFILAVGISLFNNTIHTVTLQSLAITFQQVRAAVGRMRE